MAQARGAIRRRGRIAENDHAHAVAAMPLPEPGAFAVEVPVAPAAIRARTRWQTMIADFHGIYEREYTYRLDAPVEIVGLHLIASAEIGKLEPVDAAEYRRRARKTQKGPPRRRLRDRGRRTRPTIYDAEKLEPGMELRTARP